MTAPGRYSAMTANDGADPDLHPGLWADARAGYWHGGGLSHGAAWLV